MFIEYGAQIWVGPAPPGEAIVWIPYYYSRATWAAGADETPNIEDEWHQAVVLLSRVHAAQETGDSARLVLANGHWDAWLAQRDTPRRKQRRSTVPSGGARPHPSMISRRWGI